MGNLSATMKLILLLFFSISISFGSRAQEIILKGTLQDQGDQSALSSATIRLSSLSDTSIKRSTVSGKDGSFSIQNLNAGSYLLQITYVGYDKLIKTIDLTADNADMGKLSLSKTARVLKDVTIKTIIPPATQKGDTVQYNANAFKVNPDANVEDLVKKMPGITVDNKGTVTAHGETVQKVTIDGREFFGDDAT
ncbi:MAG: hypothetical protein C5B52_05765, partial [Bacteroidetes bacterium]